MCVGKSAAAYLDLESICRLDWDQMKRVINGEVAREVFK